MQTTHRVTETTTGTPQKHIQDNVRDWRRRHKHTITRDCRFDPQFKTNVGALIEKATHEHNNP